MRPSGQPVLPNGGSKLRPLPLLVGTLGAFACIAAPPLLVFAIPAIGVWIASKVAKASRAAAERRRQAEAFEAYYARWHAEQATVINPGWRI